MSSTRKASVLGAGALALAVLGFLVPRATTHDANAAAAAPRAAATAAAPAPEAAHQARSARRWPAGTAFVYAMDSARVLTMGDDPSKGLSSTMAGRLAVAVVEAGPDAVRLRLQIQAPQHRDAPGFELDDAELGRAFYADAAPDGRFKAFAFQKGTSARTRAEQKGLAQTIQLADAPASATWKATELDGTGEYVASYERLGGKVHKSKDRYERALGAHGLTAIRNRSALSVTSSTDFTLTPNGWPEAASMDDLVEVKATGVHLSSRTRTKATLVAVETVDDLAALVAAEQASLADDAPDAEGFAESGRRADENRVAGANFNTLAQDLRAGDVHAKNDAQGRMAALFRIQPGEAALAADAVLHGDLADDAAARTLGALGSAGTPEAQGALSSVIRASDAAAATRAAAAASLGMTEAPTQDSEDALVSAMSSSDAQVRGAATLGAGNLVQRMNAAGSGDAAGAVDALITALQSAATDDQRRLCLQALGNTGDARALAPVEQYLGYATVSVRAAAVFALRFMTGDSVDGDLTTAFADPVVTVRRAAAGTLPFRSITPILAVVTHVLETDSDVSVRLSIVNAMQMRRKQEPGLTSALQWAESNDPAAEVRKAAQSALASP